MPEILDEKPVEEVKPAETKPTSKVTATVIAAFLGVVGGYTGDAVMDNQKAKSDLESARVETLIEEVQPAYNIIEKKVVDKDTLIDTVHAPEVIKPIMYKFNPGFITDGMTEYNVAITKKDNDSLMFFATCSPDTGRSMVVKIQFRPDSKIEDTTGVK